MTADAPGHSSATPLSRRQLRELERRRALEESGQDPDAPENGADWDELERERQGFAAPVELGAEGAPTGTGPEELGYEEFTRELKLDQMLTRRELRALYEARRAQEAPAVSSAEADFEALETERIEAEHEAVLLEPVVTASTSEEDAEQRRDSELGVESEIPGGAPAASAPGPVTSATPAVHWSTVDEGLPISTSSLVLPAGANHNDLGHAFDSTGEIIVTGVIDLPRSLAMTGAHPDRYDSVEIDRILDAADAVDQVESDAAPVRASRAVSTYALPQDVVQAPTRGGRLSLPVVLASTGGVLLVGVGALLAVALSLR